MPRPGCDVCCNPSELARSNETFKQATLIALCDIYEALGGGGEATDVDVLSVIPGTGATNLGKADDSPHTSGDVGVFSLAVRNSAAATLSDTDLDYTPIAVNLKGSIVPDINVNYQTANGASLLKLEDDAHVNQDAGVGILGVRNDNNATSRIGSDGDYGFIALSATGAVNTVIFGGTQAGSAAKFEDQPHASGDAGIGLLTVRNDAIGTPPTGTNGDYAYVQSNALGAIYVDVNFDGQQLATKGLLKLEDSAHVTADAGVVVFGYAQSTIVANVGSYGDYTIGMKDLSGREVSSPYSPPEASYQATNAAAITDTTSTAIKGAAGASTRNYVTDISITNTSAVPSRVDILDGATIIWRAHIEANASYEHTFNVPLRGSVNTAVNAQCATTATSTFVSLTGFTANI